MDQFVFIEDMVIHQKEVISTVNYQLLLIPALTRPFFKH